MVGNQLLVRSVSVFRFLVLAEKRSLGLLLLSSFFVLEILNHSKRLIGSVVIGYEDHV